MGEDRRPWMRAAYAAFDARSATSVEDLLAVGDAAGAASGPYFYARLYAGLYEEASGRTDASRDRILEAIASPYAQASGDYMAAVARMHASVRGWKA